MAENEKKEKKTCKYSKCKREPWKDDVHCIFHSVDIEGKKEKFKEAFNQEFERQKVKEEKYDFEGFIFPDDISFYQKEFDKDVEFSTARFSGKANFNEAQFSGEVGFFHVRFSGEAGFGYAKFLGEADFNYAKFSGESSFYSVKFFRKASFRNTQFSEMADFWFSRFFTEVDFSSARFSRAANFLSSQFSGKADFFDARFSGVKLAGLFEALRNRGIKRIWKGRYKIKNFRFYMSVNIARRYPVIDRMTKDAWYLDDYQKNHPFIYALWNVMAKCGQSIARWALWSLGFAFYFAVNFSLMYYVNPWAFNFDPAIKATNFLSFLYYSIVTFTTLGFGDIIPTANYVQGWVMAEVIMGYVMLGGLISILANKLARRS